MRVIPILIFLIFGYNAASAQVSDSIDARATVQNTVKQPLHVLITRNKSVLLESTYTFNTRDINAIYQLDDRQKSIERFGEAGKYGALLISSKMTYLSRFLKKMGIIYPFPKVEYGRKGTQSVQ